MRSGAALRQTASAVGQTAPAVASTTRATGSRAADRLAEIQRSRLIAAAITTIADIGYERATVAHITDRARVSRRTFYELFANREECVAAVLDHLVELLGAEFRAAGIEGLAWCERVRAGLWTILCFLDREPLLARVCVVQAARAGSSVLARRDQILASLVAVVDEGRHERAHGHERSPLTAEGLVGAALAIVHARLARGERQPLRELLGELMGMIVLPYLGPAAARRELARPAPAVVAPVVDGTKPRARLVGADPLADVSMRLTYRTVRVLQSVAAHPGASNRQTAQRAGIADAGQVSKLLARLQANGLLDNSHAGYPKGEPNAWTLTAKGQQVVQRIDAHMPIASEAA